MFISVHFLSKFLFPLLLRKRFAKLGPKARTELVSKCVSLVHSVTMIFLGVRVLLAQSKRDILILREKDSIYQCISFSLAYFIYDLAVSIVHFKYFGPDSLVHAVAAFVLYFAIMVEALPAYFGIMGIFLEVSTVFLNPFWILDRIQLFPKACSVLVALFAVSFFFCRVVYGPIISWMICRHLWQSGERFALLVVGAGLVVLNLLNYYWFLLILKKIKRRSAAVPKVQK